MKAVIMAGGLGERLRPLTKVIPKPLLPLGEKSILDILIESLSKAGVTQVFLATNYKSEMFHEYFSDKSKVPVSVHISKEDVPLGTAGHLSLLTKHLTEPFFVLNGDILTNLDFKKIFQEHIINGADMTVVTKEIETPLAYGVVKSEGNAVKDIHEKPNIVSEIIAGIYVMSPTMLQKIPYNEHRLMTDVIREAVHDGFVVRKYLLQDYWLDIGQMENYKKALGDIAQGDVL
jgi:NDP-mannose synthase